MGASGYGGVAESVAPPLLAPSRPDVVQAQARRT